MTNIICSATRCKHNEEEVCTKKVVKLKYYACSDSYGPECSTIDDTTNDSFMAEYDFNEEGDK